MVTNDALVEDSESVTLTLDAITSGDADLSIGSSNSATINIADDDVAVVSIVATDGSASEPTDGGQFTVSLSNPSDSDTIITYTVTGDANSSDYVALSGNITILAHQTSATIDVTVLDDSLLESTETITVTLDAISSGDNDISIGSANTATVSIADNDSAVVTIVANDNNAAEPADHGQFTFRSPILVTPTQPSLHRLWNRN